MSDKLRVMIGTPHNRIFTPEYVLSYSQTLLDLMGKYDMGLSVAESAQIFLNRNIIVSHAVEHKVDYLIFVDTDMMWIPAHIEKLIDSNKDVIGGLCTTRKPPFRNCVYESDDGGGVRSIKETPMVPFRCFAIGSGFLLLRKSVITRIWDERYKHGYPFDPIVHNTSYEKSNTLTSFFGEDISFSARLRKMNIDIWCHPDVRVGHMGSLFCGVKEDE